MPTTRSAACRAREPAIVTFHNMLDLRLLLLSYLPLLSLMSYGQTCTGARKEVNKLLRHRVARYVRPFFSQEQDVAVFFAHLGQSRAWIVGSVALAVVSLTCNVQGPANLNIMAQYGTAQIWVRFFVDKLGYSLSSASLCSGFYAQLGHYYLVFTHEALQGKTITVTTARKHTVCELFLRCRTTLTTNAVSASEIVSVYADLTSHLEGLWGHGSTAPELNEDRISPFPGDIALHERSSQLGRPCGLACPARPRWSTDIAGIGHWCWGGMDGRQQHPDALLEAMRKTDIKYRIGLACANLQCAAST
ncbi:hypothetical protein K438DRAFT_1969566 [Mycena galopus ATCC 62051]|nr:hypothetical protein K438DRAFT_1969566 [Mycena galopus ATCC 62051]